MSNEELLSISQQIDECFYAHEKNVKETLEEQYKILAIANVECQDAMAQGDLRENAQYEQAVRDIQQAQKNIQDNEFQLSGIEICKHEILKYTKTGAIAPFSTVHLKLVGSIPDRKECQTLKEEYVFKLFMAGVTDTKNHMLAVETEIGQMLIGKRVGDVIKIRHRITQASAEYRVENFI